MNRPVSSAIRLRPFLCALILLTIVSGTVRSQHKPNATWVDVDLDNRDVAKEVNKTVQPAAIDVEKRKSIWREPAWYVSIGGSVLDIVGSIAMIDGKRIQEGNPLFRGADGKVALARALPLTAASLFLQYRYYKNPKHRKMAIVSMVVAGVLHATLGGARGLAMR
jgi:hypothetical protein